MFKQEESKEIIHFSLRGTFIKQVIEKYYETVSKIIVSVILINYSKKHVTLNCKKNVYFDIV